MQNLTGQTIDRYHILEKIGEGGMAVVYKAYDTRLEREVAIKIIRKEAFPPESINRIFKRFEREAKALARLSHSNIVKVHDYGEYEGSPYLVMEYQPGGTLKAMLGKPLGWNEVSKLLIPVAKALGYAHQQGILHRDVKPSNILITNQGEPMLTDFGIAKILDMSDGQTLTGTGLGVGTPEYMAPEQGLGKEVDARADIYSLGVVLYELVTGRKPYTADTPIAVIFKHMTDPLPRPGEVLSGLSEEIEKVLLKALAKEPANRYQNMAELAAAIEKVSPDQIEKRTEETAHPQLVVAVQSDKTIDGITPLSGKDTSAGIVKQKQVMLKVWAIGVVILVLAVVMVIVIQSIGKSTSTLQRATSLVSISKQTTTPVPYSTLTNISNPTRTPLSTNSSVPTLGIGSKQTSSIDGMVMVFVPAGEFTMGMGADDAKTECLKYIDSCEIWFINEEPVHKVFLDSYWIDQTEVTNAMYQLCVFAGSCKKGYDFGSIFNQDKQPVVGLGWDQAKAYCEWADRQLPTEAQWEKAARGMDGNIYPWGNISNTNKANYGNVNVTTIDVGNFPGGVSPYGALDMLGNVWEWVADWYGDYPTDDQINPTGPIIGDFRILRGGSWEDGEYLTTAYRGWDRPNAVATNTRGFRCVDEIINPLVTETSASTNNNEPIPSESTPFLPEANSKPYRFGNLTYSAADDKDPIWSKDGEKIVYVSIHDSHYSINKINMKDYKETRIIDNLVTVKSMDISPVGNKILFESELGSKSDIYIINDDGSNYENLTDSPSWDNSPSFSPDGSKIVYSSNQDGIFAIYSMDTDGSDKVKLFNLSNDTKYPIWSPNGNKIGYLSSMGLDYWKNVRGYIFNIFNLDDSVFTNFPNNAGKRLYPAWSPDGGKIAFISTGSLTIVNDKTNIIYQSKLDTLDEYPTWSHDGKFVLYVSDQTGNADIYSMNCESWETINLTNYDSYDGQPSWSPDDSKVAFQTNRDGNYEIYIMNADGSME